MNKINLDEFPTAQDLRNRIDDSAKQRDIDCCNEFLKDMEYACACGSYMVTGNIASDINTTGPIISSFFKALGAKGYWVQIGRKDKPNKIVISWSKEEPREE